MDERFWDPVIDEAIAEIGLPFGPTLLLVIAPESALDSSDDVETEGWQVFRTMDTSRRIIAVSERKVADIIAMDPSRPDLDIIQQLIDIAIIQSSLSTIEGIV